MSADTRSNNTLFCDWWQWLATTEVILISCRQLWNCIVLSMSYTGRQNSALASHVTRNRGTEASAWHRHSVLHHIHWTCSSIFLLFYTLAASLHSLQASTIRPTEQGQVVNKIIHHVSNLLSSLFEVQSLDTTTGTLLPRSLGPWPTNTLPRYLLH